MYISPPTIHMQMYRCLLMDKMVVHIIIKPVQQQKYNWQTVGYADLPTFW